MSKIGEFLGKFKRIKLNLPLAIVLVAIILGGTFYAIQINKQKSIERQQELKMQEDKKAEEAKTAQTNKEYIAKRRLECYDIIAKERKQWNNVDGGGYVEEDICRVRYTNEEWKKGDPIFSGWADPNGDGTEEYYTGRIFTKDF